MKWIVRKKERGRKISLKLLSVFLCFCLLITACPYMPGEVSVSAAEPRAAAPALHPQTLMVTTDNENNAHTGKADGDIDTDIRSFLGSHPVDISFTLNELPTQSAYLAVKAFDVDEESGEKDFVYLNDDIYKPMDKVIPSSSLLGGDNRYNDSNIGYLSGTDETWNVTMLKIPLEKLVKGKNVISVTVAPNWYTRVDWMQLILDGGAVDSNIESFSLKLKDAATADGNVSVKSDVTIKQKGNTKYITEYTLTQESGGDALDACFGSATATETAGLTMPLDSPTGNYKITGLLKDPNTEEIKAIDNLTFYFMKGVGIGPKVSHTLTPETLTNQSVTIKVNAEGMPGVTNVSVSPASRTVTTNGTYQFTVNYTAGSTKHSFTYSVKVDNIDKTPPTISCKPITVPEDAPKAEVQTQLQEALSATDDRKIAENPFTYTVPADFSNISGVRNITVKAMDAAGNTATKTCTVNVTARPLSLAMGTLTAVSGSKDSFALKAVLKYPGADAIEETGFVWGVMPNPTLELKNGTVKTASAVKTKGGVLSATATGITPGVEYNARAYAKVKSGSQTKTVYSDAKSFGFGIPNYGTFSVSGVSGSTFTIKRTGGSDGRQTVYYRTVNGSAIGGTHFTHAAGTVVFENGQTSKTVTVSEKGVTAAFGGKAATSYSNADRTYSFEIYRVDGGGKLGATQRATRTMTKNNNYTVNRALYTTEHQRSVAVNDNNKWVADNKDKWWRKIVFINDRGKNAGQGNKNFNVQRTMDVGNARENAYLKATADGYSYRLQLDATETDSGYEHIWISNHAPNSLRGPANDNHTDYESIPLDYSSFGHAYYTGRWEIGYHKTGTRTAAFPSESGLRAGKGNENPYRYKDSSRISSDNNWVLFDLNDTAHVWFAANGNKKNMWYVNSYTDWLKIRDAKEPRCIGVAPMAGGTYLPGDPITVALVFDEIVDGTNSGSLFDVLSINTSVGTLKYAGGANTNVLYFTGNVQTGSSLNGSSALKVTGINNSGNIKDMCDGGNSPSSYSGSTNVTVDASKPDVTITANTSGSLPQHKATIKSSENTVQYTWTKSTGLPAAGWQTLSGAASGKTLTEIRGASGKSETWYLHVLATASSGASTHTYKAFTFMQPAITGVSVRADASTSSADVSDTWKNYKHIAVQYAGAQTSGTNLTFAGPQTSTQTITTASGTKYLKVTQNGVYTLTLADGYGNVVTKTIEVKKIDTNKPTVKLQSGGSTDAAAIYNSVAVAVVPADTGGSGVAKVEYVWTGSASVPSSGWTVVNKAADGSYQIAYSPTETVKTQKYLHVRVTDGAGNQTTAQSGPYQVIKKAEGSALPKITVTGNPASWAKSANLQWTVTKGTGASEIKDVIVPSQNTPVTGKTSGTCTVTKNGNYLFSVTDANGNTVSQMVTVTKLDTDAPTLDKITATGGKSAKIALTGVTDNMTRVLDGNGNFKEMSGSGIAKREYQLEGASSWTAFSGDSFSPPKNGTYKIRFTDKVGNVSKTYSVELSDFDKTKPSVTCKINATKNASGWYTTYPLPVELTYEDPAGTEGGASGIASVQYKWITGSKTTPTTGLSSLNAAAVAGNKYTVNLGYYDNAEVYYLYYKVTDKAGNVTEGFSDVIKKDSYKGSATVSGPDKGQPAADGLEMKLNSLVYGPSGGRLTGGMAASSAMTLATMTGHAAGQKTYSGTPGYTAKTPGNHYFRLYPTAAGGSSYYWAFYVRKVNFDSRGGSEVPAQLVWHDSTDAVKCTVTEPPVPTRTGYTFGGWYTNTNFNVKFSFNTQVRQDTTLYAWWIPNKYTVQTGLYQPNGKVQYNADSYTYGKGYSLPTPTTTQSGFVFDGWYEDTSWTGKTYTSIGKTEYGDKFFWARFKDVQAPTVEVTGLYEAVEYQDGWIRPRTSSYAFRISLADNLPLNQVTLFVKCDDGSFTDVGKRNTTDKRATVYIGHNFSYFEKKMEEWLEGEHTYVFKAVDAAGNETLSEPYTLKWDKSSPEIKKIDYGTVGTVASNGITYLCGKEEIVLSVPVSDDVSGVNELVWYQKEKGTTGIGTRNKQQLSGEKEETATLRFGPGTAVEFQDVYCTDKAVNSPYTRDYATIEVGGKSYNTYDHWTGIIVEDTAPTITLTDGDGNPLSEDWYESAPGSLKATVKDGGEDGTVLTSGIKSITYTVNGHTYSPKTFDTLTSEGEAVHSLYGYTGIKYITVTAEDHAGNTASTSVVLKIKGKESTPAAKADYPADELYVLAPNSEYKITVPAPGGIVHTVMSDKDGRIPFVLEGEEGGDGDMCGKTVFIQRVGFRENSVTYTQSSNLQQLTIAARPARIAQEKIDVKPELAVDAENAIINLAIQDVEGTKEYSIDEKATWTDVPDNNAIQNLKPGSIIVRVKATDTAPHGLSSEPKTIDEGSQSIHAAFDLNGDGAAGQPATVEVTGKSTLTKPAAPSRVGYEFKGWYMEPACVNEWRFEGDETPHQVKEWRKDETQTTFDPPTVDEELTITLYAKWRETTPPELTPKLTTTGESGTATADGANWYHNLTLTADYSDNVAVTKLSVSVDGGDYKELDISSAPSDGSNPKLYHYTYTPVLEGVHTYRFKAEDAAGNVTESTPVTAKLDTVNPALGEADFSQGYHSFWDWIVKNESLQITVPVEDKSAGSGIEMSGVESVKYALTPTDGTEQAEQSAELSDDNTKATIQIEPDFKGTIRITAYDNAGNTTEKMIGVDGSGINGVIVENNAPVVTILADREVGDDSSTKTEDAGIEIATAYYNAAPRLYVKVTDDKAADNNALITSGLQSVTWSINGGIYREAGLNFETGAIKTAHSFTISSLEGMAGTVRVTVKAVDQAGNETTVQKTVNIKTKEKQPAPKIDYQKEILTGLVKNAKYKVLGTDGNEEEITADGSGHIKIREEWFGREVQICKAGTSTTLDSAKTDVKLAARPAPPKMEAKKAETIKGQADGIIGALDDASSLNLTTLEYSTDDGKSWKPVTADMLTDGEMQGCASGAWLFRVPACDTAPYGETTEVIIGAGKALAVSFEENGGSEVAEITGLSWHDAVDKPEDPVRQGYALEGWYQEADFENIWHFKGENPETVMEETDVTLYAKWRDNADPALSAVLTNPRRNGSADGGQWYNSLLVALTYSDNEKVTALYVGVDLDSEAEKEDSSYTALSLDGAVQAGKGADGSVQYRIYDNDLKEGEHTYTFKAVDAAGNETITRLNARLDTTAPEMGKASYEKDAANLWDWIIKKDSLTITVPVTDKGQDGKPGSGVETVDYTLTTADGGSGVGTGDSGDSGSSDNASAVVTGTAKVEKVKDGEFTATITVPANFKGKVKVAAKDKAGNTTAEKTLGVDADGKNGVIVEDNAPDIHFSVDGGEVAQTYYETAPQVDISVDDTGWAGEPDGTGETKAAALITGGIASVACTITNGSQTAAYTPETKYDEAMKESDSFAIPADKLFTGINTITVAVTDHAGNTAQKQVQVKVKTPEDTPKATIGYVTETLNGLEPDAEYRIAGVGKRTDEKGSVPIEEGWIGTTISVVRMGSEESMTESVPQSLSIPVRPEAPNATVTDETYPDAGDGMLTMTETGKVYQISTDSAAWTDAETDENKRITGLLAKDYYVRARAVENQSFYSKEAKVSVGSTPPTPYETPGVTIDYRKETLSGLVPDAEYIIEYDGSTGKPDVDEEKEAVVSETLKADENGNIPVKKEWLGQKLSIVRPGNGKEKSDSAEKLLDVPVRPGAPNPVGANETGVHTRDAKLTNLTPDTAYDISKDGGESWTKKMTDADGEIKGVDAPAEYIVRVAATDSSFSGLASAPVEVDGSDDPGKPTPVPGVTPEPGKPTSVPGVTPEPGTPAPTGHIMQKTEAKEPTCMEAGNKEYWTCSVCGKIYEDEQGKIETDSSKVTIPAAGHTFSEQWTVEKEATEKEPGRELKVCERCGAKLYRTIDPLGIPTDPNAGKIEKEVEVLPGAPDIMLNNSKEELVQSVLTAEEIAEIGSGTDAKIWLEIAPDVNITENEKEQVQRAAEESVGDGAEVIYFDLSLFKQVGNGEKTIIHEPEKPVSITIVIPEEIRNKDALMVRNYRIIRLHEGKTDIIDGTYKEESAEFTFETDKFSTYAICYKDSPKQATPGTPTPVPGDPAGSINPGTPTPAPGGTAEPGTQTSALDESGQTGNEIEKRKDLSILLATGKQKGSAGIKLTWLKWKDALGYEVYWSYCDGKKNYMKLKTVKAKRTYTHKKVKKERAYKYYIVAYKMVDGMKKYVAKSPVIHVAMKYEKRTNAKKITANKTKVILSLTNNKECKKTFKIRVKVKKENSKKKLLAHTAELRYYTDDRKVVKVSRNGKITAKGKGKCTVYVIANNGVCKKITVTVK